MTRPRGFVLVGLLALGLALFAGCYSEPEESAVVANEVDLVERTATIALEIESDPESTEQILERHGLTADEFEEMLMEISEDEEMRKVYNARIGN